MPLDVDCTCGERLQVSEALAGLSVRCRGCGKSVAVPRAGGSPYPPPPPPVRPAMLLRPVPPVTPPPAAPTVAELKKSSGTLDPAANAPEGEGWFSGGMIGGLGAMLLGAVWLIAGLAVDRIFFYPIIIFVVGVGTFIKGWLDNR